MPVLIRNLPSALRGYESDTDAGEEMAVCAGATQIFAICPGACAYIPIPLEIWKLYEKLV